jgi:hypothetical protein
LLQATDQFGAKYEEPLAVGDRVRLFARTNEPCTDGLREVIGVNGSVLGGDGDRRRGPAAALGERTGRAGGLGHVARPGERAPAARRTATR